MLQFSVSVLDGRRECRERSWRVNTVYFNGTVDRRQLAWSWTFTSRKFDRYNHTCDTVMVTMSLDKKAVPVLLILSRSGGGGGC